MGFEVVYRYQRQAGGQYQPFRKIDPDQQRPDKPGGMSYSDGVNPAECRAGLF